MKYDRALNIDSIASMTTCSGLYPEHHRASIHTYNTVLYPECDRETMFTFLSSFSYTQFRNAPKRYKQHKHVSNTPVITNITLNSSFSIPLLLLSFAYCYISLLFTNYNSTKAFSRNCANRNGYVFSCQFWQQFNRIFFSICRVHYFDQKIFCWLTF